MGRFRLPILRVVPPAARVQVVEVYADRYQIAGLPTASDGSYNVDENIKTVFVYGGGPINMPAATAFQEGKIYTVTKSMTGAVLVNAAQGEKFSLAGQLYDSLELTDTQLSRDFTRHSNLWIVQ